MGARDQLEKDAREKGAREKLKKDARAKKDPENPEEERVAKKPRVEEAESGSAAGSTVDRTDEGFYFKWFLTNDDRKAFKAVLDAEGIAALKEYSKMIAVMRWLPDDSNLSFAGKLQVTCFVVLNPNPNPEPDNRSPEPKPEPDNISPEP